MGTRYFNVLIGHEFTRYNFSEAQANLDLLYYPEAFELLRDWAKSFGLNPSLFELHLNLYAIQT